MNLRWKNILYTLGLFSAMFLVWHYRQGQSPQMQAATGTTMGPITYNVKYFDEAKRALKPQIDSLLEVFNQSLNTYIPDSEISQFNKNQSFTFNLPYFYPALQVSKQMYELTEGAFDPSIGALINAWGFGPEDGFLPDSTYIDSVKQFVGFNKIDFTKKIVSKEDPRINISFSASAKGYGVDVVADYLESLGIANYFVEIGGEVRAKGSNLVTNNPWKVGILHPDSDEINQSSYAVLSVDNSSMATSGNYFNYHIIDGVKYGHTIDPNSGYPIEHNLLSASVLAPTCHEADALATAFMVMGLEKAISFLEKNSRYQGLLIYSNEDGSLSHYASEGVTSAIETIQ